MNLLEQDGIYFNISKIKAHVKKSLQNRHHQRNDEVDQLAKDAQQLHQQPLNYNDAYYEYYFNNNSNYVHAYHYHRYARKCEVYKPSTTSSKEVLNIPRTSELTA